MLLEKIQKENDIKQLKPEELEKLAEEIRQFLVEKISVTGGHLASNLGSAIPQQIPPMISVFCPAPFSAPVFR